MPRGTWTYFEASYSWGTGSKGVFTYWMLYRVLKREPDVSGLIQDKEHWKRITMRFPFTAEVNPALVGME